MNDLEHFELNFYISYKQIKEKKSSWLYSPIYYSPNHLTAWRLSIDNSDPHLIGVYLTLIYGAPCTLQSYNLFMLTNKNPPMMIFLNRCTLQRTFPTEPFSWGFQNFCTRRELKEDRKLICDRKTKLMHLRCTMAILNPSVNDVYMDRRFANELFQIRPLDEWIEFLRNRCDLPELQNRVNTEIEKRLVLS